MAVSVEEALSVLREAAQSPAAQRAVQTLENELGDPKNKGRGEKDKGPAGFPKEKAVQMLGGDTGAKGSRSR